MKLTQEGTVPSSYTTRQEFEWDAAWIEVDLWVELPFWLMVGNTSVTVEVGLTHQRKRYHVIALCNVG
jgi:hypothetical protein